MDHRMGPGARVCRRRCHCRVRLVGIPGDSAQGSRDKSAVRVDARAVVDAERNHESARAADRVVDHVRALHRHLGERAAQFDDRRHQVVRDRGGDHCRRVFRETGELEPVRADGMGGRDARRRSYFLCVYRIRRGVDRGRGSCRSQPRPAARNSRLAVRLHRALHPGCRSFDRDGAGAQHRYHRAARVRVPATRDARHFGIDFARRSRRIDVRVVGADAGAVAGVLRGIARRIAAARVLQDSSQASDAIYSDDLDRNRRCSRGRVSAD